MHLKAAIDINNNITVNVFVGMLFFYLLNACMASIFKFVRILFLNC